MSELSLIDSDAFQRIKDVADLYVKGVTSEFTIGRRLGIKAVDARHAINTWKEMVKVDAESRDLAREHLEVMIHRYDTLIQEANENLDNLKTLVYDEKVSSQINATIKVIADLDKVRVDLLQKAGLLDASDLGDEMARLEEQRDMVLNILRNDLCDSCKDHVKEKIREVMRIGNPDMVVGEVVDE